MATDFENPDEEIEFDIDAAETGDDVAVEETSEDETPEVEEEPDPEPQHEETEEAPEQPRRNKAKERIAELSRRAAEAEYRAAEAERRARDYEERLSASNVAQVEQAEVALKSELAVARRELVEAKSLGDYEREAEATARMAKLSADLSNVEAYRANVTRQRQPEQAQERQQPQTRVEPRTAAWIETNSWFNPQSSDYDAEMAAEAQHYARKLEIRLQKEGRGKEIGSEEYFAVIDEYIRSEYSDMFDDAPVQPKRKMPTMTASKDVAPVGRQSAPVQPAAKKGNKVRLSGEQREMAERMRPDLPPQQAWANYARYM